MFQSVIEHQGLRSGRFGTGATVSLLVHVGVFAAALFLSSGVEKEEEDDTKYVIQLQKQPPMPQPPKGNPTPPTPKKVAEAPKPKPKRDKLVQPKEIPPTPPENAPEPQPEPAPVDTPIDEDLPYVEGGDPNGVENGGVVGAIAVPDLSQVPAATGVDVLPFGTGMTPPKLLSGKQLQYTREALEARVHGLLIVRCTITREGTVEDCRVIKGLAHMNEAAISALESRRYSPVYYQGRPVSVSYTFNVKLELPY